MFSFNLQCKKSFFEDLFERPESPVSKHHRSFRTLES